MRRPEDLVLRLVRDLLVRWSLVPTDCFDSLVLILRIRVLGLEVQ